MTDGRIPERLTTLLGLDPDALSRIGLESAVKRRMRAIGLETEEQYADRLDVDMAEFERLAMAVMVHETSFFRYPASFDLLVDEARRVLAARPDDVFRVQCVASSTGEEPCSIVMALIDAGIDLDRVYVDASDVSERAIEYARRGRYRGRSIERLPKVVRERWFKASGDTYELDPEVRGRVRYRQANALDVAFGLGDPSYDALFCRNLMIYLVPEARRRLLRRLREMLRPRGLFFVGHAEVAALRDVGLELATPAEAFACRLVPRTASKPTRSPAPSARTRARPAPPAPRHRPAPPPAADPNVVLAEAARLADAGDLEEARRALRDGIRTGPATADHYHLLALVESARGRDDDSEEALRRALYLDPHHYPSLMQLALLAETKGERGRARRLREKAARVKEGEHGA
ncbi:MAG: CheR family methyltransferase [Planctomycetota bacterium]|nr:CheR family methyltransferase [Planctomycetota bacterium]